METLENLVVTVAANVIGYYICKWLDDNRKKNANNAKYEKNNKENGNGNQPKV